MKTELTDARIVEIAKATKSAEPGREGYVLPITFARAIERECQKAIAALDMFLANNENGVFEVHAPDGDCIEISADLLRQFLAGRAGDAQPVAWPLSAEEANAARAEYAERRQKRDAAGAGSSQDGGKG